jgi:hypothetical protein
MIASKSAQYYIILSVKQGMHQGKRIKILEACIKPEGLELI